MDERKRSNESLGVSSRTETKRMKQEVNGKNEEHQLNDIKDEETATDKQLRERNSALREVLLEKNQRIRFLEGKCMELFTQRHVYDTRLQIVLNQWTVLLKALHVILPDVSEDIEMDVKSFGTMEISLPKDIKCELDEWYLHGTEPVVSSLDGAEHAVDESLEKRSKFVQTCIAKVLNRVLSDGESASALKQTMDEKITATTHVLQLENELVVYKRQLDELRNDLNAKEFERHKAMRQLHRLQPLKVETVPESQATTGKSNDPELQKKIDSLQTELRETNEKLENAQVDAKKSKSAEHSMKQSIDALEKSHDEKMDHLTEELTTIKDEYQKLKHKSKDIEQHISEKWDKKLNKLTAENSKLRARIDDLSLKNAELRQRASACSLYKDQFTEYKTLNGSLESELREVKKQLETIREKKIKFEQFLSHAASRCNTKETEMLHLQVNELKIALESNKNPGPNTGRETKLQLELDTLREEYLNEQKKCIALEEENRCKNELMSSHEEEINAMVLEIEAVSKETEMIRNQMTKTMLKLSERDQLLAKVNNSLVKAEQTNAITFDEMAGVRLQVASLVAIQKAQKSMENGLQETLKLKEQELEKMKLHLKTIEILKNDAEKQKQRYLGEIHAVKQSLTQSRHESIPIIKEIKKCTQCEIYKKEEMEKNEKIKIARLNGISNEISELEQFELFEARKKLNCSVCQDRPKEVLISKCSHMFCKVCMENNLKTRNRKCPTCKKMFGQDDIKNVWWT